MDATLAEEAHPTPDARELGALARFVGDARRLLVLTGAGCSTASGIPDYRDANGQWKHPQPVLFREFTDSLRTRQRYWARSMAGWHRVGRARPNAAHRALVTLESRGHIETIITQNVDGLHQRAGARRVIDLHGRLDQVRCLICGQLTPREELQHRLRELNPGFGARGAAAAPDGDAHLPAIDYSRFSVADCAACGGVLKPDVVFFGESIPAERHAATAEALAAADGVLVLGSSLMVFSGFRIVRDAARAGLPIAAVNIGRTRADDLHDLHLHADVTTVLPELLAVL